MKWDFAIMALVAIGGIPCLGQNDPATQPPATGELDLTFTQRSPLSDPKELARRLHLKPADVKEDYDLSQRPFKAYVPKNFDAAVPVGIFVYLGYKDTVATPPLWEPVLDKSHLIFISPVCHSGQAYPPAVPLWQTMGLAIDAVHNLKNQYTINDKRIYLMSCNEGSTQISIATSDVFTGFVSVFDHNYSGRITLPDGRFYPPSFPRPPAELFRQSQSLPFFAIGELANDQETQGYKFKLAAMTRDGFKHVKYAGLSLTEDLHFPNFKAEWFSQQALPFLDQFSVAPPKPATRPTAGQHKTAN